MQTISSLRYLYREPDVRGMCLLQLNESELKRTVRESRDRQRAGHSSTCARVRSASSHMHTICCVRACARLPDLFMTRSLEHALTLHEQPGTAWSLFNES
jgi:hypothetical protein